MSILSRIQRAYRAAVSDSDAGDAVPTVGLQGGPFNLTTGMGTSLDKSGQVYFSPTIGLSAFDFEVLVVESWAARKFINIPVDDMWVRGRTWTDDDESTVEAMDRVSRELEIPNRVSDAMKAARIHGTGLLLILTDDSTNLEMPLKPERVTEGGIKAIHVFDRFDASIESWVVDPMMMDYGQPEIYRINPTMGENPLPEIRVHRSRIIRFDGIRPPHTEGWRGIYDRDWGVSELVPAINDIGRDAGMFAATSELANEASMVVFGMDGYRDALMGHTGPDEPSIEKLASDLNIKKSVYRSIWKEKTDTVERLNVQFGGLADLLDRYALRLAAIADIPATRFMGRSPVGMNATGESDAINYAVHVAAMQERILDAPMRKLDDLLARHAGVKVGDGDPPEYRWNPLLDLSDMDRYSAAKALGEAAEKAQLVAALDENEAREMLSQDEVFGELEKLPEEDLAKNQEPELDEMMMGGGAGGGAPFGGAKKPPSGAQGKPTSKPNGKAEQ